MAIPTTRTKEAAEIRIDSVKCTGCGLCVSVCKDFSLIIENNKVRKSSSPFFGCTGCGHCMAICPEEAIEISGRELSTEDLFEIPERKSVANYDQLLSLLQHRRSIREFKDKNVEDELIEKILTAARTAPMGLPPSDVNILIFKGKDKTRRFARDFSEYLKGMKFIISPLFLAIMYPFWSKENNEFFKMVVSPMFKAYTEEMDKGNNYINYDAPLAIYFYSSPYTDPADPIIAATYAMVAAETLGLGTCMLGAVHPFIQNGRRAKKFRNAQGIKFKSKEGLFVIFGHPAVKYKKGINRTFASVETA